MFKAFNQFISFLKPLEFGVITTTGNRILTSLLNLITNDSINVFLGTTNTLWTTPGNWSLGRIPVTSDKVVIRANCSLNTTTTVRALTIETGISLTADTSIRTLTVKNDFQLNGTLDLSTSNLAHSLVLTGNNLYSNGTFLPGTGSTVTYNRSGIQPVLGLNYSTLFIAGTSTKTLIGDTVARNLTINSTVANLETDVYNLTVTVSSAINGNILRTPTNTGKTIIFSGVYSSGISGTGINAGSTNDIEFACASGTSFNANTFTARNIIISVTQSWTTSFSISATAAIVINNGITFTINGNIVLSLSGSITGTNSLSTFSMTNATLNMFTNNAIMSTGIFNFTTSSNLGYLWNGTGNIPYTNFSSLTIGGTGIKTITQDTFLNGGFTVPQTSTCALECSNYDFIVTGSCTLNGIIQRTPTNTGKIIKFIATYNSGRSEGFVNAGSTNDIELVSGGVINNNGFTCRTLIFSGTQTFSGGAFTMAVTGNILIKAGKTVSITNSVILNHASGIIDGEDSLSILDNRSTINYRGLNVFPTFGKLFVNQAANIFNYVSTSNQNIRTPDDITPAYRTLGILGGLTALKILTSDLTVATTVAFTTGTLDLASYNFTCTGSISGSTANIYKKNSSTGLTLLIGGVSGANVINVWDFSGNGNVEFRGGYQHNPAAFTNFISGTGTYTFSTNNQTFSAFGVGCKFDGPVVISGAITVTNAVGSANQGMFINNSLNGTVAGSILDNRGGITLVTNVAVMTTGQLQLLNALNFFTYAFNATTTINLTSFWSLGIYNTSGILSTSGATTLLGTLSLGTGSNFDLSSFDFTIAGAISSASTTCKFSKTTSSTGLTILNGITSQNTIGTWDFSGNGNVELRSGSFQFNPAAGANFVSGSGTYNFTTGNSSINSAGVGITFNGPITIASGITVTNNSAGGMIIANTITGANSTSILDNRGIINYTNTGSNFLTTGKLQTNNAANTFIYGGSGAQNIRTPDDVTPNYWHLTIGGSGIKNLISDITLTGNLTTSTGNLELSTFLLNVGGTTSFSGTGGLSKSSATNPPVFIGAVTYTNSFNPTINFSVGNSDVEFRGGLNFGAATGSLTNTNFGSGTLKFTTNNQSLTGGGNTVSVQNILISGAITLTTNFSGASIFSITNSLNGNNANSILDNRGILYYQGTSDFMTTGKLFVNQAANTFYYSASGTQNVRIPDDITPNYYNLGILGSGIKTLLSNTTLTGAFSTAGTATLELGSFLFTVTGTTTFNSTSGGITKSSATNPPVFIGAVTYTNSFNPTVNFSVGNSDIEFRGGLNFGGATGSLTNTNFGSGTLKFTTNNQSLTGGGNTLSISANTLISGAITVTYTGATSTLIFIGTLDGNNTSSIFDNRTTVNYQNATAPFSTSGKLYANQAANTWIYGNGNQDIRPPADPTPGYKNLTLNGTGVKKLLGNVSVKGTYILTGPATLNSNGFALTNP